MKLLIAADGSVGLTLTKWLLDHYPEDIACVVTTSENQISSTVRDLRKTVVIYSDDQSAEKEIRDICGPPDLGILAWWPKIIKSPFLDLPRNGFINTHPSLLPYNRGKHYNFWALVEQAPFGVTLHGVDPGIDSGDIIAQRPIQYDWEDTGETLYRKACCAMVELFIEQYPQMRTLKLHRIKQDPSRGSLHHSNEIEAASRIDLDRMYPARDLLNLLRARTFRGHPGCWFAADGQEYEIRVEITRKKS